MAINVGVFILFFTFAMIMTEAFSRKVFSDLKLVSENSLLSKANNRKMISYVSGDRRYYAPHLSWQFGIVI